jgi:kynurenine formamidase
MAKIKKIIDLSNTIYPALPGYPGLQEVEVNRLFSAAEDGFTVHELRMHTHSGTHMDAPMHFEVDGISLDQIPLENLMGEAALVNLPNKKEKEGITASDLEEHGKHIKEGDIVVLNTGWYKKRGPGETWQENFPYITKEAAEWLVNKKVKGVGTDTVAIDMFGSPDFAAHHTLFAVDIYVIEELYNLDEIGKDRFFISIMPLNIPGVDASPVRAIAIEFE